MRKLLMMAVEILNIDLNIHKYGNGTGKIFVLYR